MLHIDRNYLTVRDSSLTVTRTGHVLPLDKSRIITQLQKTETYAQTNEMKINYKKTKLIIFNPCKSIDFMPEVSLSGQNIEVVE